MREEFLKRFENSVPSLGRRLAARGRHRHRCAAYGLSRFSYNFGLMQNEDISLLLPVAADPAAGGAREYVPQLL